jgi:hypothetical protein
MSSPATRSHGLLGSFRPASGLVDDTVFMYRSDVEPRLSGRGLAREQFVPGAVKIQHRAANLAHTTVDSPNEAL